jgi:hypothetical protein
MKSIEVLEIIFPFFLSFFGGYLFEQLINKIVDADYNGRLLRSLPSEGKTYICEKNFCF